MTLPLYASSSRRLQDKYVGDVKNFHRNCNAAIPLDEIDQIEERIYTKPGEIERIMQTDERILEEIGGTDGITLIIGHCGVQTGPDLLKMTNQAVDTSTLFTCKDRSSQTYVPDIDVKV